MEKHLEVCEEKSDHNGHSNGSLKNGLCGDPDANPAFDPARLIAARFPGFSADPSWPAVSQRYPTRAAREYLELMQEPSLADPIFRQCAPRPEELSEEGGEDAVSEEDFSPLPGLLHRYPDRALLIPTTECFVRCRHCMRKRLWNDPYGKLMGLNPELLERWRGYLANHEEIEEVILSGGDPLTLSNHNLDFLLEFIGSLPHLTKFRVHSRAPVVAPSRITVELIAVLVRNGVTRMVTQFNHPAEITAKTTSAVACLNQAGVKVENQSVLLAGVNDHPEILGLLCKRLREISVAPYYLHHPDSVRGAMHFSMSLHDGWQIYKDARALSPTVIFPDYVVDQPGSEGKAKVEELVG